MNSSSDDTRSQEMVSCWGRFKLIFSRSKKLIKNADDSSGGGGGINFPFSKSKKRVKHSDAFRYSPLSYAQNFDDGVEWEADDQNDPFFPGFSSRYAAPFSSQSTNTS